MEKAIFAAGCFWGVQDAFDKINGVVKTTVGYTGGRSEHPTYEEVSAGDTGHAEAILIEFNPAIVSFDQLLEKFWEIHDPTQLNRQGQDVGSNYRSAVFYLNDEQKKQAEKSLAALAKSGKYRHPIVTVIEAAQKFYPAEEYHQKYFKKTGESSCHI
ncbi:MAG: peptide-methionine (S)-S-oxide reductase MsrA [Patescibacteria group bacterium]